MPMRGEGHEREVHCIEHQLNRHEDSDDVAFDKKRSYSDGE
jgi:hypothetical protein